MTLLISHFPKTIYLSGKTEKMETPETQSTIQQPVLVYRLAEDTFSLLSRQLTIILAWSLLSICIGLSGLLIANQIFFNYFWMMHLSTL